MLTCTCGCQRFHSLRKSERRRLGGRFDTTLSGVCRRCGRLTQRTIKNARTAQFPLI